MIRTALAEIVGTFIIVLLGTGSMMLNEITSGEVTHFGVCVSWGVAVYLAIWFAERIGNGHLNPAVTIAVAVKEKLAVSRVAVRIVCQCIGATVASVTLHHFGPTITTLGETVPHLPIWEVFSIEVVISFALMLVIEYTVAKQLKLNTAAILIAAYVFAAAFVAGPYTGASMNPARSLGPAIVGIGLQWMWLYALAPTIGMLLAIRVTPKLHLPPSAI